MPFVIFMALVFLTGRGHYIPVSFISLSVRAHIFLHIHQETKQNKKPDHYKFLKQSVDRGLWWRQKARHSGRPRSDLTLILWLS